MDYKIYLIEDCDGLKYVGSTDQTLNRRLTGHRSDKKRNHTCSSSKLNLDDCSITELEKCDEENRWEREQYWKDKIIDCVNERNMVFDQKAYNEKRKGKYKEYNKQYQQKNKEQIKQWREKNKEKIKEQRRDRYIETIVKYCLDDLITQVENKNK